MGTGGFSCRGCVRLVLNEAAGESEPLIVGCVPGLHQDSSAS